MWKNVEKIFFPLFYFCLLKTNTNDTHMQNIIQILRKMNPWIQKIWKYYQSGKIWWNREEIGGKGSWKPSILFLRLVMRFLTKKQVFKAPSWYLTVSSHFIPWIISISFLSWSCFKPWIKGLMNRCRFSCKQFLQTVSSVSHSIVYPYVYILWEKECFIHFKDIVRNLSKWLLKLMSQ